MKSCHFLLLVSWFWLLNVGTTSAQQSKFATTYWTASDLYKPHVPRYPHCRYLYRLAYDPTTGITRLVSAMKNLNQEFEPRKTELRRLQQRIEQATSEVNKMEPGSAPPTLQTKPSV